MNDFLARHPSPRWYRETGRDGDVVVSSRVRLSRNLSSFVYPPLLGEEGLDEVRGRVAKALGEADSSDAFIRYDFEKLSDPEAAFLGEEGAGEGEPFRRSSLFCRRDGGLSVLVNNKDHVRISAVRGGLSLQEAWTSADELDSRLENLLDYAVSLEWGYLSTELGNLGAAIRVGTLLHLPGMALSNQLDKAGKAVEASGHTIRPFFAPGDGKKESDVPGDLYLISGGSEIGLSEREILEKLEEISGSLLNYEREMRTLLFEKKREFLEDQMSRALGILERAKFLQFEEASKLLSLVRMGCSMGCVDHVDGVLVTSLLFRGSPAQVRMRLRGGKGGLSEELENKERAALIRAELRKTSR